MFKLKQALILASFLLLFPHSARAALGATAVWEFRTTGNNNNGGGYTSGGTDYSQQDASQLSVTDGATSGIGVTTLTSATGGFTAAMIGNIIYLRSGTNLTVGWYEITAYTDTNTVTLDRAPDGGVGGVSSGVGEVGGARAVPTDAFFEALTAGNTVYLKVGTYTLTENVNIANDGTYALPITVKGYNTARGDNPTGDSRPTIAANAYDWTFDNYWTIRNLILTTTDLFGFYVGLSNIIENCKSTNNSPTANRSAFLLSSNSKLINSEGVSTNGDAVSLSTYNGVIGSYLHDSNIGISSTHRVNKILFNIINTNTTGISAINTSYNRGHSIVDNTIYNSTTGITLTTTQLSSFMNNIIDSNTTGASATSEYKSNWWDYNNWSNNGADVSNVTKGDNALALDPGFTDAPNGIFTIASSLAAKAFPGLFPGALTTGYLDTGAVQRQESTPTPTPSPTPATSPSLIIKGGPLLFKGGYTIK